MIFKFICRLKMTTKMQANSRKNRYYQTLHNTDQITIFYKCPFAATTLPTERYST